MNTAAAPMTVALSGASGLIGAALLPRLEAAGHTTRRLVRRAAQNVNEITWDPDRAVVDVDGLRGLDAVIHLAGESIAQGRWTAEKKRRISTSRVDGTRLLVDALVKLDAKPRVLVAASAIGYYGDRGEERLDETSSPGDGFLAEVCRAWETATAPAAEAGIRVVNARLGVVLSGRGGALAAMLTPFKLGVGGKLGDGRQYMSWIAIDDVVRALQFAIEDARLRGPVNCVAPEAVSNAEFTKTLGRVLNRPTVLPMPAFAARLAFGEMADELLLASTRVVPARLTEAGFSFEYRELEKALDHVLK